MKITITNSKGGTGKTTSAIMIATYLADQGKRVELWDADPQGSSTAWAEVAEENGEAFLFPVISVNARSVRRAAGPGVDVVVIDTNPHTPDIVQAAIDTSDQVLLPTSASPLDLERTWLTLDVCQDAGVKTGVLITLAEPRTLAYRQTVAALDEAQAPRLQAYITKATGIKAEAARRPRAYYGYENVVTEMGLI